MTLVPPPDPAVAALFDAAKNIPALPDVVRARAIVRARATVTARPGATTAPWPARGRAYALLLAALLLGVGIGGVAVALGGPGSLPHPAEMPMSDLPASAWPPAAPAPAMAVHPAASPPARTAARLGQPGRTLTTRESYAAELEILEKSQAAIARRDLGAALGLLAEHARRFPRGRLAEEREALRWRILAGSGRPDDARQARIAFADQFPRSVLLPRLREPLASKK